jgi:L-erythro-3,5-diaminohexanoate dehydrogenase
VISPVGVLPQAAERLDASEEIWPDEVRVRVERLNLDAASYRQLHEQHRGDGAAIRDDVRETIATRGKMHNRVTGSGGMLVGTVEEVGRDSPLGFLPGERIATLVSLTMTPLRIDDGLDHWDGHSPQISTDGHAILFARSLAGRLPSDLPTSLSLGIFDVCGAPALTRRVVAEKLKRQRYCSVLVLGAAGKSGAFSCAAARAAGADPVVGVVPNEAEREALEQADLVDKVVLADARDPVALAEAVRESFDVTIVCVDVPGCEHGAILSTAQGGTVVFFSMSTSFSAAALGAEGLAADVTMLIGNGYVPGHADFAVSLVRADDNLRSLLESRVMR